MEDQYAEGLPTPLFSDPQWLLAKEAAAKLLFAEDKGNLRPMSFEHVTDSMRERDTDTTNSGYPDFGKRKLPEIQARAIEDAYTGKCYSYPAIILFRQYNKKLRPVWMFPMSMNLKEGSYSEVIQNSLRRHIGLAELAPWEGFDAVCRNVWSYWGANIHAYGGDTTAMDAHFKIAQMQEVFDVLKLGFASHYWDDLWQVMSHVCSINILVGESSIIANQEHGIASGSSWTQLAETVFQLILSVYQRVVLSTVDTLTMSMMIGDDYLGFYRNALQPRAEFFTQIYEAAGLPANPDKQSDEVDTTTFLQRLFIRGIESIWMPGRAAGIYPTIRALNSSLNPERFHDPKQWSSDMFCVRQYMILENTMDHPLFREFVTFVVKGQKDLIPFAKKADRYMRNAAAAARLLPGLNATYNQEKRDKPLSSFRSIEIAREM